MLPNIDSMTLAEIVLTHPKTADVMEKYHLDFCCGGKKTLLESCMDKGLPVEKISYELESQIDSSAAKTTIDEMSLSQLCDHIVHAHHAFVQQSIRSIGQHLQKLVRVHAMNHPELAIVQVHFDNLSTDLQLHMKKEEVMLFPYIKSLEQSTAGNFIKPFQKVGDPIGVMEFEHESAGSIMEKIRQITGNYFVPEDGCTTYRLTYSQLEEFEHDLHRHVHLENNVLFPKAIALEKQLDQHSNN